MQDTVAAEADEHADDSDNDDAGIDREVVRVNGSEDLTGDDRVDGAESDKGDNVEESGEDGKIVSKAEGQGKWTGVSLRARRTFEAESRLERTCSEPYPWSACLIVAQTWRHKKGRRTRRGCKRR